MITIGLPQMGIRKVILKRNRQFNQNDTVFPVVPEDDICMVSHQWWLFVEGKIIEDPANRTESGSHKCGPAERNGR